MQQTNPRERYLLVCVLPDEPQVLRAYRYLQQGGLSPESIAIVGRGYRDCDAVGFAQPIVVSRNRAFQTAAFTAVVGAGMGVAFLVATGIQVFPGNLVANVLLAVTTAGLSGALGGFLVGGGVGLVSESGESIAYRNKVERGKYLLLVEGGEALVEQATRLLRDAPCESTQRYYFRPPQGRDTIS
ncbi:hypothetical protein [Anthocerotibacter panamensis]|uniref:hypothetical protein n=1 Tax=Anthocerotibacter panamensis TaxID=2857077 RepID=UPI001C4014D5|nr:hypothetical protein [Anthocerotibacter panamensis]